MRNLVRNFLGLALAAIAAGPVHAEWLEARSNHFIIYADMGSAELKDFADRLERFDQAARRVRAMTDPQLTDAQRLTIYMLKDEGAVGRLMQSSDILGAYYASSSGAFALVPQQEGFWAQRAELTSQTVFFHEYAHHLQLSTTEAALPAWVSEGFGEFFSTAEILPDGGVRIGKPPIWRGGWLTKYDGFPITEMLGGTLRGMTGRDVASLYGRGWLLTHYLTFEPGRRGQLQRYIDDIQKGVPALQAAKAAFGDDLRAVNNDLDRYLRQRSLKTLVVDGKTIVPGTVTLRPMRPGEIAVHELEIKLRQGVERKKAGRLAEEARRLAATYPTEPKALLVLGQAELAARNYAAAEAAGRRAIAADPKLAGALLVVGRARMEAAKANPAAADWKEIRSWFARANRIDAENAEPLQMFYQTYLRSGATPTANAVSGLVYAVALAPHDDDLRLDAVRQMVFDNRLEEARKLFAPTAFYPHSGPEWRERKAEIMELITKRDRAGALKLIDTEIEERRKRRDEA